MNRLRRHAAGVPAGHVWLRALLIVASGVLVYANALTGPFVIDDHLTIEQNEGIRDSRAIGRVLSPEREMPTAGRPLVNLSFAINYAVGGVSSVGYHVVNVLLHVLNGLLVFGVVRRTLELPRLQPSRAPSKEGGLASGGAGAGRAVNVAFVAALLWTLHPLNTEAVNYLTQRTELMMAQFYLLTLYASIRGSQELRPRWWLLAVGSCLAGMACKESMVTAPVAVVLYDAAFVFDSPAQAIRTRWRFYAALSASWILLAALVWSGPRIHSAGFSTAVGPWTYLLNQPAMIVEYLRRAVWPRALVMNYGWPLPLTLEQVWPSALFVLTLLGLTLIALVRRPVWGFLGIWFFLTLAPTSSIVPIATEVGAERRMYLPLIALAAGAVVAASSLLKASATARAAVAAAIAMLLGAGTIARNREYRSELTLARTVVERHPTSVAHHVLANALIAEGRDEEAIPEARLALGGDPRAHYTLGAELVKKGDLDNGIAELQTFLEKQPLLLEAVSARLSLAQALLARGRLPEVVEQAQLVLTMNPSVSQLADARGLMADAFYTGQQFDQAIPQYREYLRLRPGDVAAWMRLGVSSIGANNLEDALPPFRRAVELAPANADARQNLANALYDHGDFAEAAVHAREAVNLRPTNADAHDLLGRCLVLLGRFDDARSQFERAIQLDPAHADVREDLRKLEQLVRR